MQAHILAHFIDDPKPNFPFICLTVSGGHTQLVLVKNYTNMEVIGQTKDDAVGEAFDKAAKMLGLTYPGGPLIDKYAALGDPNKFNFPDTSMPGLDYSFSGIKTAILYFLRDELKKDADFITKNINDLSASIQYALVKMLLNKLKRAAREHNIRENAIAGGVSANSGLRQSLEKMKVKEGWNVFVPDFQYCTDNAGMIAIAAYFKYQAKEFVGLDVGPLARMPI
jgi:N6-L-threonylcarbamoyladenine synthase